MNMTADDARQFQTMVEAAPPAESRVGRRLRPEMVETNELALRRSLEAESALQAEVALLRERTAQLETRLEEQRRVFVTGVQQMLKPLADYFSGQGLTVPCESLVLAALKELTHPLQAVRRPVETPPTEAQGIARLEALIAQVANSLLDVEHRVTGLENRQRHDQDAAAHHYDPVPDSYETFVMSDAQAAAIERAILDAQTLARRPFPG